MIIPNVPKTTLYTACTPAKHSGGSAEGGSAGRKLLVAFHSYGTSGAMMLDLSIRAVGAARGWSIHAPDAPARWPHDPISSGEWFPLQLDVSSDALRIQLVTGVERAAPLAASFITDALRATGVGPESTYLIGYSQGAMLAAYLQATCLWSRNATNGEWHNVGFDDQSSHLPSNGMQADAPQPTAGCVLINGVFTHGSIIRPMHKVGRWLVLHGAHDTVIPPAWGRETHDWASGHSPSQFWSDPNAEGHSPSLAMLEHASTFLNRMD